MMALEREIKKRMKAVDYGGAVTVRRQNCAESSAWADAQAVRVRDALTANQKSFLDLCERWTGEKPSLDTPVQRRHYQILAASAMIVGGWVLIGLEAAMSAALTTALTMLPAWLAASGGAGVAIGLAYIFKALFAILLAKHEDVPRAASARVFTALACLGAIEATLFLVLFLARGGNGDDWIAMAFNIALAVAAVVTPMLSGVLFVGAQLFGWSYRLAEDRATLERTEDKLKLLRARCDHGLQTSDETERVSKPSIAKLACLLLSATTVLMCAAAVNAQQMFNDKSTSVSPLGYESAVTQLSDALPRLSAAIGIRSWQVVDFTDDGWTAAPKGVVQMPRPETEIQCESPRLTEVDWLSKTAYRRKEVQAQEVCAQRRTKETERHRIDSEAATRQLRELLEAPPVRRGGCTSVLDVLVRAALAEPGSTIIVITDGLESCRRWSKISRPSGNVSVIVVLLPPSDGRVHGADSFAERADRLRKFVDWVRIVPPWGLKQSLLPTEVTLRPTSGRDSWRIPR